MEQVEVVRDHFVDFEGKTHYFVIAAVCTPRTPSFLKVHRSKDQLSLTNTFMRPVAAVSIGISICNPLDKYDEGLGILKATGRAKKNAPCLWVMQEDFVDKNTLQGLLAQEAARVRKDPNAYIPGYQKAEERFETKQHIESLEKELTPMEKTIIEESKANPQYLSKVQEILAYYNKK